MDIVTTGDLVTSLTNAATFAEQLSKVFNNHNLTTSLESKTVRDHVNVLSATITPLKQICCLLEDERKGDGERLFSAGGLQYVSLLVNECATKLAKIAPVVAHAGVRRDNKKWNRTNNKLKKDIVVSPAELTLDETKLLNDLESAQWRRVSEHTRSYFERLGEVQIRLLLVEQVVALGILSKNASSGKVDIEKIVGQHELITRTAILAGILQSFHRGFLRRRSSLSSSDISSSDDLSSSDDDGSSVISIRRPAKPHGMPPPPNFRPPGAPPPPPSNYHIAGPLFNPGRPGPPGPPQRSGPLPPLGPPPVPTSFPSYPPIAMPASHPTTMVKPPSYESHARLNLAARKPSTFHASLSVVKIQEVKAESEDLTKKPTAKEEQPRSPEGRLFSSQHNSFGFKIKSFFRSKESLAREMKAVLENTQCVLQAFLIEHQDIHPIPHSAFHSLEATHMRDILSQLNGNSWFETYSRLTRCEHATLDAAIYQGLDPNEKTKREVVVLKPLQQNRANAWLRLLTKCLGSEFPFPHHLSERVVLVILREQLVDGERKMTVPRGCIPFPPNYLTLPPQLNTNIKPAPPAGVIGTTSARNLPQAPHSSASRATPPPPPMFMGPPPAPAPPPSSGPNLHNAPGPQAMETTYHEFTIRAADRGPNEPRTWEHVSITKESNSEAVKLDRIEACARRGGGVIGAQLRLTQQQTRHLSIMMDDLKLCETDNRFEWCWVELSLYDDEGRDCWFPSGSCEWTKIHLIAMRCFKKEYRPGGLYYIHPSNRPPQFHPGPNPYPVCPGPPAPPIVIHPPGPPRPNIPPMVPCIELSESDTDYSSDTSRRNSRRRSRLQGRRYRSDSDSDDESNDDDDSLKIDLKLKRGDDVVKKLLELWTPQSEEN